jgi:hypothetical protein
MDSELASLTEGIEKRPGAAAAAIRDREQALGVTFPNDYVEFMLTSNGGEGFVGESYLRLDPVDDVMNDDLLATLPETRAGLIVFGSDGGLEAFAFDARHGGLRIVMFPWIGTDEIEVIEQGRTFTEFLRRARAGALFERPS